MTRISRTQRLVLLTATTALVSGEPSCPPAPSPLRRRRTPLRPSRPRLTVIVVTVTGTTEVIVATVTGRTTRTRSVVARRSR